MKKLLYILLFVAVPTLMVAQDKLLPVQQQDYTKEMGDSAYSQGRFGEAVKIYESLIAANGGNVELYYNLGNAAYRSNMIGKAILNYERALRIDPTDEDVKANLEFVQSRTKDEIPEQYEFFLSSWFDSIANLLGVTAWAVIAVVAFVFMLLMVTVLVFNNGSKRKFATVMALLSVFVVIFANIAANSMHGKSNDTAAAIIMREEVALKSTPDNSGIVLTKVHEGRKVKIVDDTMNEWKEISLEDGTVGWVQANVLERIKQ